VSQSLSNNSKSPKIDFGAHPCFNEEARRSYARIHLPVAPKCNMQCNYCSRKFSCVNESRPGVTCAVLTPYQALEYLREYVKKLPNLSVVAIAGPGDPFANPEETLETLRLVKAEFPELLLCVATNGLNLLPYVGELSAIGVSHVTVTVNAADPEIGRNIYEWMHWDGSTHTALEAAAHLWKQQAESISRLSKLGVTVKINTIYIPGVNDQHIEEVAREVAALGADILNILPLYPVGETAFGKIEEPSHCQVKAARNVALRYLPQMRHCQRCRADAVGMLGEAQSQLQIDMLRTATNSAARKCTSRCSLTSVSDGPCDE
jgi:nitrogen fixation protein NifB